MFVEMGEIVNVVGLRGEIKLLVNGNFDEEVLHSDFLLWRDADGSTRRVRCEKHRWKGQTVVAKLQELGDRNAAEAARGVRLGFESSDYDAPGFPRKDRLPAFAYHDLLVVTTEGEEVGRVDDVLTLPANWVLRVVKDENTKDERELLIPVIDDVIRSVDRDAGRVVIEAVAGLLDDSAD